MKKLTDKQIEKTINYWTDSKEYAQELMEKFNKHPGMAFVYYGLMLENARSFKIYSTTDDSVSASSQLIANGSGEEMLFIYQAMKNDIDNLVSSVSILNDNSSNETIN